MIVNPPQQPSEKLLSPERNDLLTHEDYKSLRQLVPSHLIRRLIDSNLSDLQLRILFRCSDKEINCGIVIEPIQEIIEQCHPIDAYNLMEQLFAYNDVDIITDDFVDEASQQFLPTARRLKDIYLMKLDVHTRLSSFSKNTFIKQTLAVMVAEGKISKDELENVDTDFLVRRLQQSHPEITLPHMIEFWHFQDVLMFIFGGMRPHLALKMLEMLITDLSILIVNTDDKNANLKRTLAEICALMQEVTDVIKIIKIMMVALDKGICNASLHSDSTADEACKQVSLSALLTIQMQMLEFHAIPLATRNELFLKRHDLQTTIDGRFKNRVDKAIALVKYNSPDDCSSLTLLKNIGLSIRLLRGMLENINEMISKLRTLEKECRTYANDLRAATRQQESFSEDYVRLVNIAKIYGVINAVGKTKGYTALHWAVIVNDENKVRLLLDAGADKSIRDDDGRIPFDVGIKLPCDTKILKLLQPLAPQNGPLSSRLKHKYAHALRQASAKKQEPDNSYRELVALVKDLHALDDVGTAKKRTALHWAASANNLEKVEILLSAGADKTIRDGEGNFPFEIAKNHSNNILLIELLQPLEFEATPVCVYSNTTVTNSPKP